MSSGFYIKNWAEVYFFILLVIGFLISILSPSATISYILIFVCGLMGGRLLYERKNKPQFPYYLIIIGFFIGFILGAYQGNRTIMTILFILGNIISYYVFAKGIIQDLRY